MLLEVCDAKQLCIANTLFETADKKKITHDSGCDKSEIAFCIIGNVEIMTGEAEKKINELGRNPNNVFRLVRKMKMETTDVVGGRCIRGNDGAFYLSEKDTAIICKAHICEKYG